MKYIITLLALFSTCSFAGTLQCTGTVEKLGLHSNDRIMLKLSSMNKPVFICSPNSNWTVPGTHHQTSAETCKSILSMLMHAKSTKAQMGNVWLDGDDVPSNCGAWESWKVANIRYFMY